jgi:hypothetical protein
MPYKLSFIQKIKRIYVLKSLGIKVVIPDNFKWYIKCFDSLKKLKQMIINNGDAIMFCDNDGNPVFSYNILNKRVNYNAQLIYDTNENRTEHDECIGWLIEHFYNLEVKLAIGVLYVINDNNSLY